MRMFHAAFSLFALAALSAVAAGCAGAGTAPGPTAKPGGASDVASAGGPPTQPAAGASGSATVMEVRIGSGPDTGSHRAVSTSVTCTYGLSALEVDVEDSFGNQFADDSSAGLSELEVIVPDAKLASRKGTEEFVLSVRIGKPSKGNRYRINTLPDRYGVEDQEGSGRLTLEDGGAIGVIAVRGRTDDGVPIDATVRCNRILDADGRPRE